jgi:hypothetical protein
VIISQSLLEDFNLDDSYSLEHLGKLSLKGKDEEIPLVGIKK